MPVEWLPTKEYGRFPYEYLEKILGYLAENKDIEIITYDDLPWGYDYDIDGYPSEYRKWLELRDTNKIYIILQHDVDMFPERTLKILELEKELGIKSNIMIFRYYIDRHYLEATGKLKYEDYLTPDVIEKLQEYEKLGYIIGYHINAYECANFNFNGALKRFKDDVIELRGWFDIKYCSAHGGLKDKKGNSNGFLTIPDELLTDVRWINNFHGIRCTEWYSDSLLLTGEMNIEQFLESCKKGNRYQLLIHPQYYHTPFQDWREDK